MYPFAHFVTASSLEMRLLAVVTILTFTKGSQRTSEKSFYFSRLGFLQQSICIFALSPVQTAGVRVNPKKAGQQPPSAVQCEPASDGANITGSVSRSRSQSE